MPGFRVGLILRDSPWGHRWCHVGGRVLHGESLVEAATRHIEDTLGVPPTTAAQEPYFVNQFFPEPREGMGLDPRKHAIAACFAAGYDPGGAIAVRGEALDFQWFQPEMLPTRAELWPGTDLMIDRLLQRSGGRFPQSTYEALTIRHVSHNQLMWQTPALAMTAMAFLLTVALGDGEGWKRALAAALSTLIAVISAQLMARHSKYELADAEALLAFEAANDMVPIHGRNSAAGKQRMKLVNRLGERLAKGRSRDWWLAALLLFAAVSALLLLEALAASVSH